MPSLVPKVKCTKRAYGFPQAPSHAVPSSDSLSQSICITFRSLSFVLYACRMLAGEGARKYAQARGLCTSAGQPWDEAAAAKVRRRLHASSHNQWCTRPRSPPYDIQRLMTYNGTSRTMFIVHQSLASFVEETSSGVQ